MSIEVKKEDNVTGISFSMGEVSVPAFVQKKPIIVQETKLDKPKEKKLDKKKEIKPRYYYEMLEENYYAGRFNRLHSTGNDDDPNSYSCPILCVAGDLKMCDVKLPHKRVRRIAHAHHYNDHAGLAERICDDKRVICIKTPLKCSYEYSPNIYSPNNQCDYECRNEPDLAYHLACDHHINNLEVVRILKKLYNKDGKPKELPKTEEFRLLGGESVILDHSTFNSSLVEPLSPRWTVNLLDPWEEERKRLKEERDKILQEKKRRLKYP